MASPPYPLPRQKRESTVNVGNGTPGPYGPSKYKVFDTADVSVFVRAAGERRYRDVSGQVTVTKTAGAVFDTFSITFGAALPPTTKWYHQARRTHERSVAVTKAGTLVTDEAEKELSKQSTVISELRRDVGRALTLPVDQSYTPELPILADGETLQWNDAERRFDPGPDLGVISAAEANAERAELALEQIRGIDPGLGGPPPDPYTFARPALPRLPSLVFTEPLVFADGIVQWRDADGNPSMPTAEHIDRQVAAWVHTGIDTIVPIYPDFLGLKFHRAPISAWDDLGTGQPMVDWHSIQPAHVEDADVIGCYRRSSRARGAKTALATGRQGDTYVINDIDTVAKGGADPMTGGMTLADRVDRAVLRTRELVKRGWDFYGDFDVIWISHEIPNITNCTAIIQRMVFEGDSDFPPLASYGVPIGIALSSPDDIANTAPIAALLASWGIRIIVEQGSVGVGYRTIGGVGVETYIPEAAIDEDIAGRSEIFGEVVKAASLLAGYQIGSGWNAEAWLMGFRPQANITLSALTGSSITVTTDGGIGAFLPAHEGWWLSGYDGGQGRALHYVSASEVTINGVLGAAYNGEFTDLALEAGKWSITPGYMDTYAYPMGWPYMQAEIGKVHESVGFVCIYAADGYVAMPNQTVWPPQSFRGSATYRDRMIAMGEDWVAAYEAQLAARLLPGWTPPSPKIFVAWDNVTGKPEGTTVWSAITNKPNSLAGYGIDDAFTKNEDAQRWPIDTVAAADKPTPADADLVSIVDSANGNVRKKLTMANLWLWVVGKLNGTNKATPINADRVYMSDSTLTHIPVYATWTQVKAFLKTYFDTIYPAKTTVQTWSPTITFATPGNLAVTYAASTFGERWDEGDFTFLRGRIVTSTFTHTTASGNLQIVIPFAPVADANDRPIGECMAAGWTKANYTALAVSGYNGLAYLQVICIGSGQILNQLTHSDVPSGGTVQIAFSIRLRRV